MKRREVGEKKSSKKLVTVVMPAMIVMILVTALFVASAASSVDTFANDTGDNTGVSVTRTVNVTAVGLPKTGDMDNDGTITFDDVILLTKHYYFGDTVYADPDVDSSGAVDLDDIILLVKHYYFGDPIYP